MTTWEQEMSHESTRLYYEKLKQLVQFIDPYADILEIGLDVGISARCFLEFLNVHLTSVDCGDVDRGIKNITNWGLADRWTFHHQRSDEYFAECQKQFDLIYIDGDHAYAQVKRDINNAWKFIKRDGLIICHDFLHQANFRVGNPYNLDTYGVTRAVSEFLVKQNVKATIYPPHPGLIMIEKI